MDTCIWKPIIVTCGSDKTIRIWNYRDNFVEIIKKYEFDPIWFILNFIFFIYTKYIFSNTRRNIVLVFHYIYIYINIFIHYY